MKSGIYCIEDALGRLYYGSAVDFQKRWKKHLEFLRIGKHHNIKLQRAWNKHGPDFFTFYVVEIVQDLDKLLEREQRWLDFVFSTEGWCYNICKTAGSQRGMKRSAETKAKISAASKIRSPAARMRMGQAYRNRTPETNARLVESLRNRVVSQETRQKMSKSQKGRKHTQLSKGRIALTKNNGTRFTFQDSLGNVYADIANIEDFANSVGLDASHLRKVAKGLRKQHKGFRLISTKNRSNK